jgi:hypothetical protein
VTAGAPELRWRDVARLGLAQVAIGAVAALMMSTLNRVMVVELRLPASVPSALVALHFAAQLARARLGFASDGRGRRAPYLLGGAALLAAGVTGAAAATALVPARPALGLALAALAYLAIGLGLSAAGTALLALVAESVPPAPAGRRGRRAVDHDDRRDRGVGRHHGRAARPVLAAAHGRGGGRGGRGRAGAVRRRRHEPGGAARRAAGGAGGGRGARPRAPSGRRCGRRWPRRRRGASSASSSSRCSPSARRT